MDKIIAGDIGRNLAVACYDLIRSLEGTAELVVTQMTSQPTVAMVTVTEKAQVMNLHNPAFRLIIIILFHLPADFLANLA